MPTEGVCQFLVGQQADTHCRALRVYALAGSGAAQQNIGMPPSRALSGDAQLHLQSSLPK